jgi:hypothetical protein
MEEECTFTVRVSMVDPVVKIFRGTGTRSEECKFSAPSGSTQQQSKKKRKDDYITDRKVYVCLVTAGAKKTDFAIRFFKNDSSDDRYGQHVRWNLSCKPITENGDWDEEASIVPIIFVDSEFVFRVPMQRKSADAHQLRRYTLIDTSAASHGGSANGNEDAPPLTLCDINVCVIPDALWVIRLRSDAMPATKKHPFQVLSDNSVNLDFELFDNYENKLSVDDWKEVRPQ